MSLFEQKNVLAETEIKGKYKTVPLATINYFINKNTI